MLYLNPSKQNFKKTEQDFYQEMFFFVLKRMESKRLKDKINVNIIMCLFENHVYNYLEDILIGTPSRLIEISNGIKPFLDSIPDFKVAVKHVFNYELFRAPAKSRYDAYNLAEALDVRTCTYCNRNYTNTVITKNGDKITRPQFDHYFDQASHPILALSFYNLIPCCSICNSNIKGSTKMTLEDHIHPYLDNALGDIRFTYEYSARNKSGLRVKVDTLDPSKVKNTVDVFKLEEVYNSHIGELTDLLKTKRFFSDRYLSILTSNLLEGVVISKEEIYRIVFGSEYNEESFANRPFSKFKSDILKELGII